MYNFIMNMWIMKRVTADQVNSFVPKFITQEQAVAIYATTQIKEEL